MSEQSVTANPKPGLSYMVRSLRSRNYKLFFSGQLISLVGNFLTQTTTAWLIFRLALDVDPKSGSEYGKLMLGVVAFAGQIPLFFTLPFAGVIVERMNKRKLLVVTQSLAMVQSFVLAFLALTHLITIPWVIALAVCQGLINAMDMPGRQSFIVEMVDDREDLANAIALNSIMVHGSRVLGPALAGVLIYSVGEGYCFLLDGVSYLFVIAALLAMHLKPMAPRPPRRGVIHELKEGFTYIWGFKPIRAVLLMVTVLSLTGMPAFNTLAPVFADYLAQNNQHGLLHWIMERKDGGGGELMLGFLLSTTGAGALCGALLLAARRSVAGLGKVICVAALIMGLGLIGFAYASQAWVALLIVPFFGYSTISTFASANTILQTLSDDDKRGRVMSFFALSFIGMAPFGALLSSYASRWLGEGIVGAQRTLIIAAVICLGASAWLAWQLPKLRQIVRPIYIRKGIIKEVADGMESTAENVSSGATNA